MLKLTFESSLTSLLALAREDEFPGVHSSEVLRSLEPDATVSASNNDGLSCEVCLSDRRNRTALVFDKLKKRELHIVVFTAERSDPASAAIYRSWSAPVFRQEINYQPVSPIKDLRSVQCRPIYVCVWHALIEKGLT